MRHFLALFALALTCGSVCADDGAWSSGGPFGGNVYRLQVDYSVAGRMYASATGGLFRKGATNQPWVAMEEGLLAEPYVSGPLVLDRDGTENLFVFDETGRLYRSENFTDPYAPPGSQTRVTWRPTGFALASDMSPIELIELPGSSSTLFLAARDDDPNSPTGQSLLFRSTDGGATFAPVPQVTPDKSVAAVAVDPADANHILAGLASYEFPAPQSGEPVIWESNDGGQSFHAVYSGDPMSTYQYNPELTDLAFSAGGRAYAIVEYQIMVSLSNGAAGSWTATSGNLFQPGFSGAFKSCSRDDMLLSLPSNADVVYTTGTGITKWVLGSTAGPPPWPMTPTKVNNELTANTSLAGVNAANLGLPLPAQVCVLAPSVANYATTGFLLAATNGAGLLRTVSNVNDTWTRFNGGNDINNGLGGVNIRTVAFHPSNILTVLAGLGDNFYGSPGIFGSGDSATSWFESNTGLKASNVRHIAFDPTTIGSPTTTVVYAAGRTASSPSGSWSDPGYRSAGIFKSVDGGSNWISLSGDLPAGSAISLQYLRNMRWITLDPRSCGTPPFPATGPSCAAGVSGGLKRFYATADGFVTNSNSDPEFPGLNVQEFTHRIVRTDNGGSNYVDLSTPANGFPRSYYVFGTISEVMYRTVTPYLVMVDPNNSQRLFAPTFATLVDFDGPGGYSPDVATGVYCSLNGGLNWTPCNGTPPNTLPAKAGMTLARQDILSAAMHPVNGDVIWVSTYDSDPETFELLDGGIYRSVDGGANWQEVSAGLPARVDVRALIIDPEDPQISSGNPDEVTLYAASTGRATSPGAVYRSDDGGLNWRSISVGLPAASATALAVDPSDRRRILAGTDFGVWEITQLTDTDGDGIPNAEEGQNGGDGNGDSTPDSLQKDVGSIGVSIRAPNGSGVGRTTSDVIDALSTATIPVGGCLQTEDVQSIPSINYGQDLVGSGARRYFYPRNLWRIQVNDCSRAIVDVIYHDADFVAEYGWSFRYFGPQVPGDDTTVGWHSFSSRAHLVAPTVNRWRLTLDANQFGSYRTDTDRILFVGGPACHDDRLLKTGFETTEAPQPACGN